MLVAKIKIGDTRGLERDLVAARKEWQRKGAPLVRDLVIGQIQSGKSPVQGFGQYQQYSEQYAKREKNGRLKPVNLTLDGKMLSSLKTRLTRNGFVLFFSSRIAKYHDTPGLARVLRKMLPTEPGLKFIPRIQSAIIGLIDEVISRNTRNRR